MFVSLLRFRISNLGSGYQLLNLGSLISGLGLQPSFPNPDPRNGCCVGFGGFGGLESL